MQHIVRQSTRADLKTSLFKAHYPLLIHGQEVSSPSRISIEDPVTETAICTVSEASPEDVRAAIQSGQRAFKQGLWSRAEVTTKYRVMTKLAYALQDNMESFALKESIQTGRGIREMRAQLGRLPEWIEYFASVMRTAEGSVPPFKGDMINFLQRSPLGVVGQITPYNHPLLIAIKKLAPALAAGNSIVIKPSELAPVSVLDFAQMALDAGVPEGVINVVPGYGPITGKALCESPILAKLDVTGGTEAGKKIAMAAGQNLITCTAELGGKTPLLVFGDVDVNAAVNGAAFAAFVASGQTCVMGSWILVHSSIYKEFIDKLVQKAESLVLGDPLKTSTDMGPVISKSQLGKIEEFVQIAKREGATVLTGGHRWGSSGHYFSPTVIGNCTPDMTIVKEEVFGPVVCVLPFETEQEAIQLTNDSIYGLAAGVWTQDIKKAHRVSQELDVGIVWVNGHHHNDPSSPWGGFKQSGLGKENGIEAYNSYTRLKSTVINYGASSDWFGKGTVNSRYG